MAAYIQAEHLDAALQALAGAPLTVLAGATDLFPAAAGDAAWGRPRPNAFLDISRIASLRGIRHDPDAIVIGALTTWADVIEAALPPAFDALKAAAAAVGGRQIQNRGTLGGNLCNASPAADGAPCLLALDAAVELQSAAGRRVMPLARFLEGNRRTAKQPNELLTAIIVPQPAPLTVSAWEKLGARDYLVISIAMVAAVIAVDGGQVSRAAISVGACAPTAVRLPVLEEALLGAPADAALAARVSPEIGNALAPIDDVRADAEYRREAALVLIRRCLARCGAQLAAAALGNRPRRSEVA